MGTDGSRGAAAAEAALWSGQRGTGHPGGHGLEHRGGRVLQRPELRHQPPAEAGAERREGRWVRMVLHSVMFIKLESLLFIFHECVYDC